MRRKSSPGDVAPYVAQSHRNQLQTLDTALVRTQCDRSLERPFRRSVWAKTHHRDTENTEKRSRLAGPEPPDSELPELINGEALRC